MEKDKVTRDVMQKFHVENQSADSFGLMCFNWDALGTWLKPSEKIAKYSLKHGVELELRGRKRKISNENVMTDSVIIKIKVPDDPQIDTLTMKFKLDTTVEEAIDLCVRKQNKDSSEYGLVRVAEVEVGNQQPPQQQSEWLDGQYKLSQYYLKNNDLLYLKRVPDSGVFGVAPEIIPATTDPNGIRVPVILFSMKLCLFINKGLEQPGIFLNDGDLQKKRQLKKRVVLGQELVLESSTQVHSVASLLKDWFKSLPHRLLQSVMEEDFERYSNNNAAGVLQVLPEPQRSLLHWLLDLLIETAKYEHVNNMSAKDLALSFAPVLYKLPQAKSSAQSSESAMESRLTQNLLNMLFFLVRGVLGQQMVADIPSFSAFEIKHVMEAMRQQ